MDYADYWEGSWEAREKRRYYQRLYDPLRHRLVVPEDAKVLDIGGGDGHLMYYLNVKKADILDISDSGIDIARSKGYCTIKGDIENPFPTPANTYDAAFCFEVFEHVHKAEVAASEALKTLRPGSVFYVGQPNMRADGVHHVRRFYKKILCSY